MPAQQIIAGAFVKSHQTTSTGTLGKQGKFCDKSNRSNHG
jgi:hypothetical protein